MGIRFSNVCIFTNFSSETHGNFDQSMLLVLRSNQIREYTITWHSSLSTLLYFITFDLGFLNKSSWIIPHSRAYIYLVSIILHSFFFSSSWFTVRLISTHPTECDTCCCLFIVFHFIYILVFVPLFLFHPVSFDLHNFSSRLVFYFRTMTETWYRFFFHINVQRRSWIIIWFIKSF